MFERAILEGSFALLIVMLAYGGVLVVAGVGEWWERVDNVTKEEDR